jgi:hypothetical protein
MPMPEFFIVGFNHRELSYVSRAIIGWRRFYKLANEMCLVARLGGGTKLISRRLSRHTVSK